MKTRGRAELAHPLHHRTLPNGLRVVISELPHLHSATLCFAVRAGSRYERAEDQGLSHFLEHMLFRGTEAHPSAHAMNLAIDFTRKRKRRETSGFDENIAARDEDCDIAEAHHEDGPSRQLERKQLFARIMTAMQQLPEDQRQVILLRELEGLQYKEIDEIMEIFVDTLDAFAAEAGLEVETAA